MRDDMVCPKCGDECWRDEVDVDVGIIYGPWGCSACGWSENPEYDCSEGKVPEAPDGWRVTPQGGLVNVERQREELNAAIDTVNARFRLSIPKDLPT
jgi:hypothetical protein